MCYRCWRKNYQGTAEQTKYWKTGKIAEQGILTEIWNEVEKVQAAGRSL